MLKDLLIPTEEDILGTIDSDDEPDDECCAPVLNRCSTRFCRCCCCCNCCGCVEGGDEKCCGYDLCGVICCSFSYFTLLFCSATVQLYLIDIPIPVRVVYQILVTLAIIAHYQAMTSDPGFVEKNTGIEEWAKASAEVEANARRRLEERRREILEQNKQAETGDETVKRRSVISDKEITFKCKRAVEKYRKKIRYCDVCNCYKPIGAHHCSVCGRCIMRMDHHCPWINSCVGDLNLRYFLQFLFYVFLSASFSIILFLYRSYVALYYPRTHYIHDNGPLGLICAIFSVILCLFFCVFVVAMGCEQYDAVTSGIPGIDAMQGQGNDEELPFFKGLRKYGCHDQPLSLSWFLPIPIHSNLSTKNKQA